MTYLEYMRGSSPQYIESFETAHALGFIFIRLQECWHWKHQDNESGLFRNVVEAIEDALEWHRNGMPLYFESPVV